MPARRIAELFRVQPRFLRSANLERDIDDASALQGYVLTPQATGHLQRMTAGLVAGSGMRAWRITGDYGVGKSSFALVMSQALSGRTKGLSGPLRSRLESVLSAHRGTRLLPVLITGTQEPLAVAILKALDRALSKLRTVGRRPRVLDQIRKFRSKAHVPHYPSDSDVVQIVADASAFVQSSGHASGLLVVLDELGKFLEYAASNPDRQDVYFLQLLAETAARSGDSPLMVVGLLHQGFSAYADRLSEPAQREWQKVAGRFEELLFDRPMEQTAALVADALNLRMHDLPKSLPIRAAQDMTAAIRLGWYGPGKHAGLPEVACRLYPLHPTVLPVLARLFSRFGQNERSLFSFLLSQEPFGLQTFSEATFAADRFYRLHNLYDYVRATFGHRLAVQSYRSHWNLIESVVESFPSEHDIEKQVLKTVAVLNLLDEQSLLPSMEAIELAVKSDNADRRRVKTAIDKLQKRRVLYFRGASAGYCLWPHTSVNIDHSYQAAMKAIGPISRITSLIADDFDTRPVVARRHYIETGNLRHFAVRCAAADELSSMPLDLNQYTADGLIIVALCETAQDRRTAIAFARSPNARDAPNVLVAVPRPLEMLQSMVIEARRWQWVAENTPQLAHDRYAAEEVDRQVESSRRILRDRVQDLVGLRGFTGRTELHWYYNGNPLKVRSGSDLLSTLSRICDQVFPAAPRVRNELVNRRELSSAAAAARMRLIEGLFSSSSSPLLGMNPAKKPPEMSMYLSVLHRGNIHIERDGTFMVVEPGAKDDKLNIRPAFVRIREILSKKPDARVSVAELFDALKCPPFGIRDGVLPLLLSVFAVIHEQELAFYEDGGFLRQLTGADFMRLVKEPASFELQYCRVAGVRASVFAKLAIILRPSTLPKRETTVLDVVRSLCTFAAELPQYAHQTKRLSIGASAVRSALQVAQEPAMLVFRDLPAACGFEQFGIRRATPDSVVRAFVQSLKQSLDELRGLYPGLLEEMRNEFRSAFDSSGPFAEIRRELARRADRLLLAVHEPKLRGFCLRLTDGALTEEKWLEALGGFVCGKSPASWLDLDVHRFREDLHGLVALYKRVEAATFDPASGPETFAVRVAVTFQDGQDIQQVLHLSRDEEELAQSMEAEIRTVVSRSRRVGLAAATRVLWHELNAGASGQ